MKKLPVLCFLFVFISCTTQVPNRNSDTVIHTGGFGKMVMFGPFGEMSVEKDARKKGEEYCKANGENGNIKMQRLAGFDVKYELWCVKNDEEMKSVMKKSWTL